MATKTMKELATETLQVQNACNLSGVVGGFHRFIVNLREHTNGTEETNTHPLTKLWVNKLMSMSGDAESSDWNKAYELSEEGERQ